MDINEAALAHLEGVFRKFDHVVRHHVKAFGCLVVDQKVMAIFLVVRTRRHNLHRFLFAGFLIHQILQSADADEYVFFHPFLVFLSLFCMSFLIVFNLYLFRIADLLRQNGMCEGIEPLHAVACEELVFLTAQLIVSRILQIQLPQQSAQCL